MRTEIKIVPHSVNTKGEIVLPGYDWIAFSSLALALKWRKRNYKLKTAHDADAAVTHA